MLLNFEHLVFPALDVFSYYNKDAWRNQKKSINKRKIISKYYDLGTTNNLNC